MSGVFLLSPGPVFLDPNRQAVHDNATVTASGSSVFTGYGATEVSLFVNVKATPTGTLPTIQFEIQEVDPGDGTTVIGSTALSTVISAIGIQRITMLSTFGGSIKVSWTVGGTTPSFTQIYATLVAKSGSTKLVDADGIAVGTAANLLHVNGSGVTQPVVVQTASGFTAPDTTHLPIEMLVELRQIRKLLEVLVEESFQNEANREEN